MGKENRPKMTDREIRDGFNTLAKFLKVQKQVSQDTLIKLTKLPWQGHYDKETGKKKLYKQFNLHMLRFLIDHGFISKVFSHREGKIAHFFYKWTGTKALAKLIDLDMVRVWCTWNAKSGRDKLFIEPIVRTDMPGYEKYETVRRIEKAPAKAIIGENIGHNKPNDIQKKIYLLEEDIRVKQLALKLVKEILGS